jgi:thioredoxin-like negative regulator of GroEL
MERLLVLALVFGGIAIGGLVARGLARRKRDAVIGSLRLEPVSSGQARILSFYGPSCDACERQKLVFSELERQRPGGFVLELRDATVDHDYARQFGLMVVPTTVVISPNGAVSAINSGYAARAKLEAQLSAA